METLREEYDWVEPCKTFLISYEKEYVVLWTFAGKLINASIAEALAGEANKVVSDNLSVSFMGAVDLISVKAAISKEVFSESAELEIPLDEEFIAELKFGECLPQSCRDEELAARYDFSDQCRLLSSHPLTSIRVREVTKL